MPVIARCPGCGGPLSETSVLALAPVCDHCRGVVVDLGGTMGLIGAYGVNDQTITRRRVEADLSVLRETLANYNGMKESCKEELKKDVERYAKLPESPEFLTLVDVPNLSIGVLRGLGYAALWVIVSYIALWILKFPYFVIVNTVTNRFRQGNFDSHFAANKPSWIEISDFFYYSGHGWLEPENLILNVIVYGVCITIVIYSVVPHFKAKAANGENPRENARHQKAYDDARSAALKFAEPLKAVADHRLRSQIVELEGLEKTVRKIEVEVGRQLITLG